jgi:NADPH-dependent 2,4-dienoyl-CoA reductase/sulfur reductase-like enzyme/nitrite reductase/ring-hydroxylating ferredoxin subunit
MADAAHTTPGPNLSSGIPEADLLSGSMLAGHVGDESVLLARQGDDVFAIGATCTHYGGPLGEGLMVGDTVRCPWHHACFSLRTGEALAAPALTPTSCWRVERRDGHIYVREKKAIASATASPAAESTANLDARMVIIGGGAAGYAAAQMLRRRGFGGAVVMLSADRAAPYDRPNLSKDYLAGEAPEEWIPLAADEYYTKNHIDLRLGVAVIGLDPLHHHIALDDGTTVHYTKLLIATGAEPIRLRVQGADLPHVRTLRSLDDCRQIITRAKSGTRAVIVGASFIGLEAAAALRHRGVEVHVVAPETHPMERVFGPALGDFIRELHESHGVTFHLGRTVKGIDTQHAQLDDGSMIAADLVLVGIGVRPRIELAEKAGLAIDRGVLVDQYLETSIPGIFAAGDIARWPDPYSAERLRVEHWVVAERQGQTAARNMLGDREPYATVPFFWTQQYDLVIDYVGHAGSLNRIDQNGDLASRDVALRYYTGSRVSAFATISRGRESLAAELAMEQGRSP